MAQNPRYRAPRTNYTIFRKGQKVLNELYGYNMYEVDAIVDSDGVLKNAKRRFREINRRFGGVSDNS